MNDWERKLLSHRNYDKKTRLSWSELPRDGYIYLRMFGVRT